MSPALIEKPEALYPGAPVLLTRFARGQETGDVRVQDYGDLNRSGSRYRIGQFLPGVVECSHRQARSVATDLSRDRRNPDARILDQARRAQRSGPHDAISMRPEHRGCIMKPFLHRLTLTCALLLLGMGIEGKGWAP